MTNSVVTGFRPSFLQIRQIRTCPSKKAKFFFLLYVGHFQIITVFQFQSFFYLELYISYILTVVRYQAKKEYGRLRLAVTGIIWISESPNWCRLALSEVLVMEIVEQSQVLVISCFQALIAVKIFSKADEETRIQWIINVCTLCVRLSITYRQTECYFCNSRICRYRIEFPKTKKLANNKKEIAKNVHCPYCRVSCI